MAIVRTEHSSFESMRQLPISYLEQCFICDVEKGTAKFKQRPRDHFEFDREWLRWNGQNAGREAGSVIRGRVKVSLVKDRVQYIFRMHHLIWVMSGRELDCACVIDHKDGDATNNRLDNLRQVTPHQNWLNRPAHKDNTSGCLGVYKTRSGKWEAKIMLNYENFRLGIFEKYEDAVAARKEGEKNLHGDFRRDFALEEKSKRVSEKLEEWDWRDAHLLSYDTTW